MNEPWVINYADEAVHSRRGIIGVLLQVVCKGWKWWDERVVDDLGRREAVSTTRLRSGLYIYLAVGPQVVTGACGHQGIIITTIV
jgi:hypothetical protein